MPDFKEQIKILPKKPGIYKFCDKDNIILYIGKAKNLKNRVNSYFITKKTQSGRIKLMVAKIAKINYTIVQTEYDAWLLENSLIKKYQPKYNIQLKDGKTYPFIAIKKERFPRVFITRRMIRDGTKYFGPFVSYQNKNALLDLVHKYFYIRTCNFNLINENIKKRKFKVCLNYHIELCKGPCEDIQSEEDYMQNIKKVENILKGKTSEVIRELKVQMDEASKNLRFETANEMKKTIAALKQFHSKSAVVNPRIKDLDVFSLYTKDPNCYVNYLKVKNGTIIQTDTIELCKKLDESEQDILLHAIAEIKRRYDNISKDIIVPFPVSLQQENFKFIVPKVGDKKNLLDLSYKNAFYYYQDVQKRKVDAIEHRQESIKELLEKVKKDLGLKNIPIYIECFDNSNIQGAFPVASMVMFRNGKPFNKGYRHYNIRTVKQIDDFASMAEVISRRYKRLINEKQELPQLIVVDGGKGQLSTAYKVLQDLAIDDKIEIIGIAKKLEEIYKPGDPLPLFIDKKSPANNLIQQLRNEAHRFAITHHRNKRIKESIKTDLEKIEGIGELSIHKLLSHFKSIKKVKEAGQDELENVVGKSKALILSNAFET